MPVYKLAEEMRYEELLGWYDYFERRPVEWRADDRAAKLLQAQGVKGQPYRLFQSLDAIYRPKHQEANALDTLKGSMMFHKMMQAKGGEVIPV